MKRLFVIFSSLLLALTCWLPATVHGKDLLDELTENLDRLEGRYWRALAMDPTGDYYKTTNDLLDQTLSLSRRIQQAASRTNDKSAPNITIEVNKMYRIFTDVKTRQGREYKLENLQSTAMKQYEKRFRKDENNRKEKRVPALDNVDVDDYEAWLFEVCDANVTKARRSGGKSSKDKEVMQERVAEFYDALRNIRVALVKYRQAGKTKF